MKILPFLSLLLLLPTPLATAAAGDAATAGALAAKAGGGAAAPTVSQMVNVVNGKCREAMTRFLAGISANDISPEEAKKRCALNIKAKKSPCEQTYATASSSVKKISKAFHEACNVAEATAIETCEANQAACLQSQYKAYRAREAKARQLAKVIKDSQKALNDQYLEDNKLLQLFKTRKDQLTKVLEELQKSKAPADKAEQALRQLDTRDAFDDVMPNGWTYASGLYCQGAPPDLSFENMTRMLNESKSYDKRWNETFPDGGKEDLYSQFKQNPNAGPKIPGSSTAGDDGADTVGPKSAMLDTFTNELQSSRDTARNTFGQALDQLKHTEKFEAAMHTQAEKIEQAAKNGGSIIDPGGGDGTTNGSGKGSGNSVTGAEAGSGSTAKSGSGSGASSALPAGTTLQRQGESGPPALLSAAAALARIPSDSRAYEPARAARSAPLVESPDLSPNDESTDARAESKSVPAPHKTKDEEASGLYSSFGPLGAVSVGERADFSGLTEALSASKSASPRARGETKAASAAGLDAGLDLPVSHGASSSAENGEATRRAPASSETGASGPAVSPNLSDSQALRDALRAHLAARARAGGDAAASLAADAILDPVRGGPRDALDNERAGPQAVESEPLFVRIHKAHRRYQEQFRVMRDVGV